MMVRQRNDQSNSDLRGLTNQRVFRNDWTDKDIIQVKLEMAGQTKCDQKWLIKNRTARNKWPIKVYLWRINQSKHVLNEVWDLYPRA